MTERRLRLVTIDDVYGFVSAVQKIHCDMDLMTDQQRYVIDAKSVMGVFSLDLSRNLRLKAYTDDAKIVYDLDEKLKPWIIDR